MKKRAMLFLSMIMSIFTILGSEQKDIVIAYEKMEAAKPNYYEILGVDENAEQKVIATSYKKLALQNHPDKLITKLKKGEITQTQYDEGTEKFKQIAQAYEILGDPEKRQQYDYAREAGIDDIERRFSFLSLFNQYAQANLNNSEEYNNLKNALAGFIKKTEPLAKKYPIELLKNMDLLAKSLQALLMKKELPEKTKKFIQMIENDIETFDQLPLLPKRRQFSKKLNEFIAPNILNEEKINIKPFAFYFSKPLRDKLINLADTIIPKLPKDEQLPLIETLENVLIEDWGTNFALGAESQKRFDALYEKVTPIEKQLFNAIEKENKEKVQKLILEVKNKNIKNDKDLTPLMVAAKTGNIELVELLLTSGAQIDFQDKKTLTALWHTLLSEKPETFTFLLKKGANPNLGTRLGNSLLLSLLYDLIYFTETEYAQDLLKKLLNYKVDVNYKDGDGETALFKVAEFFTDRSDIAKMLIEKGADPNAINDYGETPLMKAAWQLKPALVETLLNYDKVVKNINKKDKKGETALTKAKTSSYGPKKKDDQRQVINYLLKKGAK